MKTTTMTYEAPEVVAVEVAVEGGFEASLTGYGFNGPDYEEEDVIW